MWPRLQESRLKVSQLVVSSSRNARTLFHSSHRTGRVQSVDCFFGGRAHVIVWHATGTLARTAGGSKSLLREAFACMAFMLASSFCLRTNMKSKGWHASKFKSDKSEDYPDP